jgi:hypothetical protein
VGFAQDLEEEEDKQFQPEVDVNKIEEKAAKDQMRREHN